MDIEKYIRTEEFYKKAIICFSGVYKKHYKKYFSYTNYADIFVYGYIRFLEDMKNKDSFDFDSLEDRIFLFHSIRNGMFQNYRKHESNKKYINFSSFLDKNEDETTLDYIFPESNDLYYFNYCTILDLLKDFLKTYKINELDKEILIRHFKGMNLKEIKKDKSVSGNIILYSKVIKEFKEAFAKYLVSVGFINNTDYLIMGLKNDIIGERCKTYKAIKTGFLGLEEYLYDFYIYKLIRDKNNIEECAKLLNVSADYIDNIVNHKCQYVQKLYLYQIQKLRQIFPGYTLDELVMCKAYGG